MPASKSIKRPRKENAVLKDVELLEGWRKHTFGELVRSISINDKKLPAKQYAETGKFRIVDQGQKFIGGYSDDEDRVVSDELPLIVFGDHTRIFKYLDRPFIPGADGIKVLKPIGVDAKWLFHIAHALDFPDKGYARHFQHLKQATIFVPPLPEQRRIVARIEELFTRLDAGVAALHQAKAQLKRYRQSVLAAAVTGELTKEWREKNPDVEPASVLLERILKERREKWSGQRKYKEPIVPVTKDLPGIPNSWTWSSPAQLSAPEDYSLAIGPFGSNLKVSDYTDEGIPLVFVRHIRANDYHLSQKFVSAEKANELKAHSIDPGDLLITKMGEPPGDAALYPENRPHAIISADCIKLRLTDLITSKSFFVNAINSQLVANQIAPITRGVAQKKISLDRFRDIALPLPPLAEQDQILAAVEARTTAIDHLEAELDRQITRSNRLRQSILTSAFNGFLNYTLKNDGL